MRSPTLTLLPAAAIAAALALSACAPTDPDASAEEGTASGDTGAADDTGETGGSSAATIIEEIDLDEVIAAAQAEGSLVVLDGTSKVEEQAALFTEIYGIEVTATKADASEVVEIVTREAAAGTVTTDVVALSDVPAITNELLAPGHAIAWLPADVAATMDSSTHEPPIVINDPSLWSYNTEVYDTCPISNVWELTDPQWSGLVAFEDPLNSPATLDWFSQLDQFGGEDLAVAYEAHYGTAFASDRDYTVVQEWVARLAENGPLLTQSSEEASEAIGALGQSEPPVGLLSSAKFRNIDDLGYALGVCDTLEPWVGMAKPKGIVIAAGTEHPNAARLWVHFMYTQEGIQAQIDDGKISPSSAIVQPEDPADVAGHIEDIFTFHGAGVETDWRDRSVWSDLWRTHA